MSVRRFSTLSIAAALSFSVACSSGDGDDADLTTSATPPAELDVIGLSERPASLLVLASNAPADARARLDRALDQIGGAVIAAQGSRLVIAQVPDGAEAILAAHHVVARHDRALADGELAGATAEENRFVAVYSNRWHPASTITPLARVLAPDEPFEAAPIEVPADVRRMFAPGEPGEPQPDPEDQVSTPYASGTVVVAMVLPESNGAIDASTEDWSEESIRATYLKAAAALDRIAASEPNAKLRYILHFESRPAAGGLVGTVESDYEFGQRAQWNDWTNEALAMSNVMARIVGHDVDPTNPYPAMQEYQLSLRQQYGADAAFITFIASNDRGTAGMRPHATFNGPWTVMDSQTGMETFGHEYGHIFGAADEYCPDACAPPTMLHGYLGIYNANATFREGDPYNGGINDGMGENAPSLMSGNQLDMINGYTRAAWGWLDVDGDSVIDVRDTFPRSELVATVSSQVVRLTGQIIDQPTAALWRTRYSSNRITSLEVKIIRSNVLLDTIELPLAGNTRGRQAVDLTLPRLNAGTYRFELRAKNDVGNVELRPQTINLTITGSANVAPIPHLDLPAHPALSTGATYSLTARGVDPEGGATRVRVDLGGDGTFETGWVNSGHTMSFTPTAGVYAIAIETRDSGNRTASTRVERLVFGGNAPPRVSLNDVPGVIHGTTLANLALTATATDPEGGAVSLSWRADLATGDGEFKQATGWDAPSTWNLPLTTPERLRTTKVNLAAGDWNLSKGWVRDVLAIDAHTLAVAGGTDGIWFVDVSNVTAPVVVSSLKLETVAHSLFKKGNRLYVLGSALAIVDISNLAQPTELKQISATNDVRESTLADHVPVNDNEEWGATHYHYVQDGEKINDVRITVALDHARHADVVISLIPPKQFGIAPIVLRDHRPAPAGLREFTFTTNNTPALSAVVGQYAAEGWQVQVVDTVANGSMGTLTGSQVRFRTRTRAFPTIQNATRIVGALSGGELVIGGAGIQVLDVTFPTWVIQLSRVRGTATADAVLVGDTVVWAGPQEAKGGTGTPVLKGLAAIDLDFPWAPWVIRVDDVIELDAVPEELTKIGNRLYVGLSPYCDEEKSAAGGCERERFTWIGNANAFVNGYSSWVLGESSIRIDRDAFGNGQRVWTAGRGFVEQVDVSSPTNLQVVKSYPQSYAGEIVRLGTGGDVLLFNFGLEAHVGNLDVTTSTLSRVYHVTVEARDAAGAVTRATRTVHLVPYDHAPDAISVAHTSGVIAGDTFTFELTAVDGDGAAIWDPTAIVTADWDNDGFMDAELSVGNWANPTPLWHTFPAPGTYPVTFEVRDGFWARDRITTTVVVQ
jgi:subtilisin-like proprotein convertase family protein